MKSYKIYNLKLKIKLDFKIENLKIKNNKYDLIEFDYKVNNNND